MSHVPYDKRIPTATSELWDIIVAVCGTCGLEKHVPFVNAMKLEVGDLLPSGEDLNFNTCMRCKTKNFRVTQVPDPPAPTPPRGFWKIPTA